MNADDAEIRPWSRKRWWFLVCLVFVVHIGFIFGFGDRKPIAARPPMPTTKLVLASPNDELIALDDPTLFALPHRRSFSAAAWLETPEIPFQPYRWSEPPRLMGLPVERLGETFAQFMRTNTFSRFAFQTKVAPLPTEVSLPVPAGLPTKSTLRLTGELAKRRWLNPPALKAYEAAELLTNSVIQVTVLPDGYVFSTKMLPPGSGSSEADDDARKAARSAHFTPDRTNGNKLAVGNIVFEWATVPLAATNAPTP